MQTILCIKLLSISIVCAYRDEGETHITNYIAHKSYVLKNTSNRRGKCKKKKETSLLMAKSSQKT